MTDDIVDRLRMAANPDRIRGTEIGFAAMDAANEIERLRSSQPVVLALALSVEVALLRELVTEEQWRHVEALVVRTFTGRAPQVETSEMFQEIAGAVKR